MAIQFDNTNTGTLTLRPGASGSYALVFPIAVAAANGYVLSSDTSGNLSWVAGGGTVTSVSVTSANGFAGSVATSTSTPAITISTSITGVLKGNGTAISAAAAGTDYVAPSGTFFIGTTSIAHNRASASLSMTGVNIDGSAGTFTSTSQNSQFNSVGIGQAAVTNAGQLTLSNGALATTLNAISNPHISIRSTQSNSSFLDISAVRDSAGTDWTTAGTRIQMKIDSTFQAYQQFNGTNVTYGIEWGSGSSVTATGVPARMRLDSAGSLRVLSNVTSTSTTSGTVIVTGGVGMSENLYVGGLMVQGGLYSSTTRQLSIVLGTETWVRLGTFTNRCAIKILIGAGSSNSEEESEIEILGTYTLAGTQIHVKRQTYNPHLREVRVTQTAGGAPKIVYVRLRTTEFAPNIDWRLVKSRGVTSIENVVETPGAGESVLVEQLNANINNAINTLTNTTASTSTTTGALVVTGGAGISGDVYTGGQQIQSIATGLTAAGTTQGTALLLAKQINNVTVVAASSGVRLPVAVAGMRIIVRNSSVTNLNVYPNTGAQIQTLGANVAMVLVAATMLEYVAVSTTQWHLMNNVYA